MGVGGGVLEFTLQQLEHGGGTLGVHMDLLEPSGPLPLILGPVELEGIQVSEEFKSSVL